MSMVSTSQLLPSLEVTADLNPGNPVIYIEFFFIVSGVKDDYYSLLYLTIAAGKVV